MLQVIEAILKNPDDKTQVGGKPLLCFPPRYIQFVFLYSSLNYVIKQGGINSSCFNLFELFGMCTAISFIVHIKCVEFF